MGFSKWGRVAALVLASGFLAGLVQAADPARRKSGEPSTRESTLGVIVDKADRDMNIEGTLGGDGRIVTKYIEAKDRWEGIWAMPTGDEPCDTVQNGSKYWGKIWFKLSEMGRVFTGKYGACDGEPDQDFSAKWDGKP